MSDIRGYDVHYINKLEAENEQLRAVLHQVRSNMNKRAVDSFDYEGGEYAINGDTINMLVLDIADRNERIAELESEVLSALNFGYHYRQHPQMRGSSFLACKAVWEETRAKKALKEEG